MINESNIVVGRMSQSRKIAYKTKQSIDQIFYLEVGNDCAKMFGIQGSQFLQPPNSICNQGNFARKKSPYSANSVQTSIKARLRTFLFETSASTQTPFTFGLQILRSRNIAAKLSKRLFPTCQERQILLANFEKGYQVLHKLSKKLSKAIKRKCSSKPY